MVSVSNSRAWWMESPGSTTVQADWQGWGTSVSFTVYSETANGVDDDGDGLANVDEADVPNRNGGLFTGDGKSDGQFYRLRGQ